MASRGTPVRRPFARPRRSSPKPRWTWWPATRRQAPRRVWACDGASPALNTTRSRGMRFPPVAHVLELLDVDRLGTLVPVLLLEGDLGALAQRSIPIAGNPREMNEKITPTPVGRDEAEALLVREPLDRAGAHREPHLQLGVCCPRRTDFDRPVRPVPTGGDAIRGRAITATLSGRCCAWRCLSGELSRRGRDVVAVP